MSVTSSPQPIQSMENLAEVLAILKKRWSKMSAYEYARGAHLLRFMRDTLDQSVVTGGHLYVGKDRLVYATNHGPLLLERIQAVK